MILIKDETYNYIFFREVKGNTLSASLGKVIFKSNNIFYYYKFYNNFIKKDNCYNKFYYL